MFEVLDKDNKIVTAHEVMLRHADFFGKPEHSDFVFALGEDGELMVISGQMPLRMACTLRAFAHLYTVRRRTPRAGDGATDWAYKCGYVTSVDSPNCKWCGSPRA